MQGYFTVRAWTFLTVILAGLLSVFADDDQNNRASVQQKLEEWKTGEGVILFYGKVVDQTGAPVPGATIEIDVPKQTGFMQRASRRQTTVTDTKGRFEVSAETYGSREIKGSFLFIESISRDGYEYIREADTRTGFRYRGDDVDRHVPKKDQPVAFKMRKIEEIPTFLLSEASLDFTVTAAKTNKTIGHDFIRHRRIKDTHNLVYDGEPVFCDLLVRATFNTNDATWSIILSPGNTNGGIIVSEQLLYEAPDTGYQPEYTFTPEDRKPVKAKYVYLKSRDPAIYTRLEIEYINANKQFFRLSGKSVTNPYGDRNLEQATDLPYEVTKQLTSDAKAAFRQNKRPAKPDLKALIKAEKEKK